MESELQDEQISKEVAATGKLLSVPERAIFEQLAVGYTPHQKWVRALLAIDEGASRSEAGQRAGMTSRQVRYWLAKFRKLGMGIFPQSALESAAEELITSSPTEPGEEEQVETSALDAEEIETAEPIEASVEEFTAELRAKKSKDKKKKKKDKKGKGKKGKSKKDKTSKKSKKAGKKKSKKNKR